MAIALLDCNNFYASCERVFDAALRKKPIVVLSNNDGCVISRSDEAKDLGVTMGAPFYKTRGLLEINDGEAFSSNYELYGDMSARVMEHLRKFTPDVEVYSIDEAFLSLSENQNLTELGSEIQKKIRKWTGIRTAIGIAATKTLAKVANKIARNSEKADGVLDLYQSPYLDLALKRTAVENVWGIGRASAQKLKQQGIETALQLRDVDLCWARKTMSVVGARTVMELRGVSCLPLELNLPPRNSITCSRSFGAAVHELKILREAVAVFLSRAAEKLRRHHLAANAVTVFIATNRFYPENYYSNAATHSAAYPSDANQEFQTWAFECLEKIFRENHAYCKAGVILSGLVPADQLTSRMYNDERWERFRGAMRAVDEINLKHGRDTVRFAVADAKNAAWQGKCERRSPRYTTKMGEAMIVH